MPENTSTSGASPGDDGHGDQEAPEGFTPPAAASSAGQDPASSPSGPDASRSRPESETDLRGGYGRHHGAPDPSRPPYVETDVMSPLGDWSPSEQGRDRSPSVPQPPPAAPPLEPDDAPPVSFDLPGAPVGKRAPQPADPSEPATSDGETTVQYSRPASGGFVPSAAPSPEPGWPRTDTSPPFQRAEGPLQRNDGPLQRAPGSPTPPPAPLTPPPAPSWPRQPAEPHRPGAGRAPEQPPRQVPPPYQGVAGPNPQRHHPGDPRGYGQPESPRPPMPTPPQPGGGEYGRQPEFGAGDRFSGGGYEPPQSRVSATTSFDEERSLHGGAGDFAVESGRREGPQQGWRSMVSRMGIPVGKGPAELEYDHDIATINKRLRYRKTVGIAAFKGGVGKTSMTMGLASTVAAHRQDGGVVAIDTVARGSLAMRVKGEQPTDGHVKALAYDENLHTISDVRAHLMSNPHRLSVLGSHRDLVDEPLSPQEYLHALQQLHRHHEIVFVDTEPSVATPAYGTIMASLDALILVVNPSRDSAIPGREVLPWLRAHGLSELAERTIVLLNHPSPAKPHMNEEVITNHFHNNERVEVLAIPYDAHLAEAGAISLGLLDKTTRRQFVKAAAILLDKLPAT